MYTLGHKFYNVPYLFNLQNMSSNGIKIMFFYLIVQKGNEKQYLYAKSKTIPFGRNRDFEQPIESKCTVTTVNLLFNHNIFLMIDSSQGLTPTVLVIFLTSDPLIKSTSKRTYSLVLVSRLA